MPTLPKPHKRRQVMMSLRVDANLAREIRRIAKSEGLFLTDIMEWGFKAYIENMRKEKAS